MSEAVKNGAVLEMSQAAVDKITALIKNRDRDDLAVRVAIRGTLPGGNYQTEFKFTGRDEANDTDVVQSTGSFDLLFEPDVAERVQGSKVDFDETRYSAGFNIEYSPSNQYPTGVLPSKRWEDPVAQKVQDVIDQYINPGVAGHGGWVLLQDVKEGKAFVEMGGGCQGCGLAAVTLRQGVEQTILHSVPEIDAVVDLTAHEQGEDPYYSAEAAQVLEGTSPFG